MCIITVKLDLSLSIYSVPVYTYYIYFAALIRAFFGRLPLWLVLRVLCSVYRVARYIGPLEERQFL